MSDKKLPPLEGVRPDIAHALLEANPELRKKGMSTNLLVDQSKKLESEAGSDEERKAGPLLVELKVLKRQLENAETKLDTELQRLNKERQRIREQILGKVNRLMDAADAPTRDKAAAAEADFLASVGFTAPK